MMMKAKMVALMIKCSICGYEFSPGEGLFNNPNGIRCSKCQDDINKMRERIKLQKKHGKRRSRK